MRELDALAIHAHMSDLIFYGERERGHEEIADEALLRERIWANGGLIALRAHLEALAVATLSDPTIPELDYRKKNARMLTGTILSSQFPKGR